MKVYRASYILNSDMDGGLIDWFKFEQEKDDKWEKTDYGYFYPDGYISKRAKDNIQVNNCLCHAMNEKYFDRELTEEELKDLELQMRKECISALERKRTNMIDNITKQIEYIGR